MKTFTVSENMSLRDFTDSVYPQGSFAFSRLLRDKDIRVNGEKIGKNISLHSGDGVVYYTSRKEEQKPFYTEIYKDNDILIVDKFSGVNSEALHFYLDKNFGAKFIHRLDRNTSGVMAFALSDRGERELLSAFKEQRAEKIYQAVCVGIFDKKSAVLSAYLIKNPAAAKVKVCSEPKIGAEKIVTEYRVLEERGGLSLLEIRLHSGKTHQIRAHMAFCGHPVLGDEKYGNEEKNAAYRVKRQILVAKSLSFTFSGELSRLNNKKFVSAFSAEFPSNG